MTDDEFTADGEDPGEVEATDVEWSTDEQRQIALGRSPAMMRISRDHSPIGDFSIDVAALTEEARYLSLRLDVSNPPIGEFSIEGSADGKAWESLATALHLSSSGSLADVRRLLGGFLREVLPPGVHAHGLVLDHVPHNGWGRRWRRWALRLGLWLVRKSGCEVVKP